MFQDPSCSYSKDFTFDRIYITIIHGFTLYPNLHPRLLNLLNFNTAMATSFNARMGRTPEGVQNVHLTRVHTTFIDWALLTTLKSVIPLLFLATLLIAGTVFISYTFFRHEKLPEHFTLGISLTFGILLIFTAALLLLFRVRRFIHRRAAKNADREANRPQPQPQRTVVVVGTRSSRRGDTSAREATRRVQSPGLEPIGLGLTGVPGLSDEEQPSTWEEPVSPLSDDEYEQPARLPANFPNAHLREPRYPREHSPPPTHDHPSFHLPALDPLVLFPKERTPGIASAVGTNAWWDTQRGR